MPKELPFGVKFVRPANTASVLVGIDDHLGESSVCVNTWWSGEGFDLITAEGNTEQRIGISWVQWEAMKLAVKAAMKQEEQLRRKKKDAT